MKELTKIFSYDGNPVTMKSENSVVYVNLTEIAKAFPGKQLSKNLQSDEIREYITVLSRMRNRIPSDYLRVINGRTVNGGFRGTWAHQKVALRVCQKLSTEFCNLGRY